MSGPYRHVKHFADFLGIDLRSNDVVRASGFSSDGTENVVHSSQGGVTWRWGNHILAAAFGRYGLFEFKSTNILGTAVNELIGIGGTGTHAARAHKLVKSSFTITNSNANAATVYHFYDEAQSQFVFRIDRGGSTIVSQALGIGTEGSPYALTSLETVVDAVSGLAMSTPAASQPAAFMELVNGRVIAGSGGVGTFYYWSWIVIPQGLASSADTQFNQDALVGSADYRNVSAAMLSNALYLANPGTTSAEKRPLKYDGNRIYIAGLPAPVETGLTSDNVTAGSKTDDVRGDLTVSAPSPSVDQFGYIYRYVNIDKAGNRVEGPVLNLGFAIGGAALGRVFASAADTNFSGKAYNLAFGRTSSAQSSLLTIALTSGHTFQAGDIAFFWNSAVSRFIQREITATTTTSITLSTTSIDSDPTSDNFDAGGNVSVLNDALITNNARIAIFRDVSGISYLVAEVPNFMVTGGTAFSYYDNMIDGVLSARAAYVEDEFPHDPPPTNCSQISTYNGGLILSGDFKHNDTVYFSDVDGPEYFPSVTHNFRLPAKVTGHKQSGEFLVTGTPLSLHATSGVLSEFNFRNDKIGENVGIQSHLSMQEIGEGVLAFSSNIGPHVLISGRDLQPLGAVTAPDGEKASRLLPFWTKKYVSTAERPYFERAIAVVQPDDHLYILFVPFEDPSVLTLATGNSVAWVFDYSRGAWWKWTAMNMAGGATMFENVLHFTSRAYDGSGGASASNIVTYLSQQQRSADVGKYGYADHDSAISWKWRSHWESLGEPDLYKRFLRCKVRSEEERAASSLSLDLNTYIDDDPSLQSNDDTIPWSSERSIKAKIKAENCLSMMVEFAQTARFRPMIVTGYTLEAVAPFRPEMKR